jgi:hypothetical protein
MLQFKNVKRAQSASVSLKVRTGLGAQTPPTPVFIDGEIGPGVSFQLIAPLTSHDRIFVHKVSYLNHQKLLF